ncbi:MAG: SusD/RagB family nutrient-binding outer membrane lipoprotein [Pedobacter sp.]|uniref:SusD/RagB family nutrient-binding outer membrane lipoprotein n=1 Tax=Pedobacter sp. TaxID=1411316 RepID=UPI00280722E2|nr:SusD/RagB family nutrient-binding outer membrane lipoprotein [Pedobacter sp.]MDQ8006058.1 SusD/RagB family nutrient-binding outer membrane lipoprotein [Pedobacter sp.]
MRNYKNYIKIAFLLAVFILPSCTKDFKELAVNPNSSTLALPQTLLAPAITDLVSRNMTRNQRVNNELMQVHVDQGDTEGRIHRYDIRPTEATSMWNNWYLQLTNIRDIYSSGKKRDAIGETQGKTYMGISLILDAWVMSLITDMYGNCPYTDAAKAKEGIFLPKFDKQEDIYTDLLRKLEEANTLLTIGSNLPADQVSADPLYNGVALNWRKFGNSIYLRLLLRISAKKPTEVAAKIKEIAETKVSTYPLIASNAESAILKWTGADPYRSPFAIWRPADWVSPGYAEFFVKNLMDWGDPRITKWADLYLGQYAGMPSGFEAGVVPQRKSKPLPALMNEPLLGNVINYAEVQFMLAEAAVRGYFNGNAKTYYDNGITNGITLWGLTLPTGHLTKPDVVWDETLGLPGKLERIHGQKYYALYYTDFQQWYEYRRTGYPILPKGAGLRNNGEMPTRLIYPVYLYSTNKQNLDQAIGQQGADNMLTKVWWQTPN